MKKILKKIIIKVFNSSIFAELREKLVAEAKAEAINEIVERNRNYKPTPLKPYTAQELKALETIGVNEKIHFLVQVMLHLGVDFELLGWNKKSIAFHSEEISSNYSEAIADLLSYYIDNETYDIINKYINIKED